MVKYIWSGVVGRSVRVGHLPSQRLESFRISVPSPYILHLLVVQPFQLGYCVFVPRFCLVQVTLLILQKWKYRIPCLCAAFLPCASHSAHFANIEIPLSSRCSAMMLGQSIITRIALKKGQSVAKQGRFSYEVPGIRLLWVIGGDWQHI